MDRILRDKRTKKIKEELNKISKRYKRLHNIQDEIFHQCKEFLDVPFKHVIGPSREPRYVMARNFCIAMMKKHTKMKHVEYAELFNRDPSFVTHAYRQYDIDRGQIESYRIATDSAEYFIDEYVMNLED
jgi:chromosomal replication initiation ATPase DnaA